MSKYEGCSQCRFLLRLADYGYQKAICTHEKAQVELAKKKGIVLLHRSNYVDKCPYSLDRGPVSGLGVEDLRRLTGGEFNKRKVGKEESQQSLF